LHFWEQLFQEFAGAGMKRRWIKTARAAR
jgi:hypothetical protein